MSWPIGSPGVGHDIKIHVTFLLILLLGGWSGPPRRAGFVFGVVLMLALFTCVTPTSSAWPRIKIPVREIVPARSAASPCSASCRRSPPGSIAAAGPAVTSSSPRSRAGQHPCRHLDGRGLPEGAAPAPARHLLLWLAANVTLVAFNRIPAFLRRGRMLRAVLAMFTDYARDADRRHT
jgi:hypothetical protein